MIAGAPYLFLAVAVIVAAIGAWIDWRTGEIPNWVTLAPLGAAPIAHFAVTVAANRPLSVAAQAAGFSVLGALVCVIVPYVLWRAGGMGGGDVKLLAALGALLRPTVGIEAEFYAILIAAILAGGRLAWEGKLLRVLGNTLTIVINPFLPAKKKRTISPEMMTWTRFGPAIFAGTALTALLHWRLP